METLTVDATQTIQVPNGGAKLTSSTSPLTTTNHVTVTVERITPKNRLTACVLADTPFSTVVIRGVAPECFETIDAGITRRATDVLFLRGEANVYELAATLTLVWKYFNDAMDSSVMFPNNRERAETLDSNPSVRESVNFAFELQIKKLVALSNIAFLHFVGSRIDKATTESFLNAVKEGVGLDRDDPAYAFREVLVAAKSARKAMPQWNRKTLARLGLKALRAYLHGEKISRLRIGKNEATPTLEGK